ncbi:MAG: hypothetical protein JWQ09_599 [Segetibacter sp.]|nr:hypothetical protein [Segetibacter sp.]
MFISTKHLVINYGVDDTIARFFVDRDPPADNLYWHEKLLYLRPAPGYLFIPLIIDLLYRLGIDRQQLLSEEFVSTMEVVGHISALEETKKISIEETIQKCAELVKDNCKNELWLNSVIDYFKGKKDNVFNKLSTPFKSLHRGDVFLFSLSILQFPNTLFEKIAEQWFALISTLLLLDDGEDLESDKETGDENAYLESGLNDEGIERIAELVKQSLEEISTVNPVMAGKLESQHKELVKMPHILKLLNHSV